MSFNKSLQSKEILSSIRNRRSVRKYSYQPVEREKILTCINAARLAPSADNIQPWRFIILDDAEQKTSFEKEIYSGIYRVTRWAVSAPVLIVLLADIHVLAHRMGGGLQKIPFHFLDLGIAGEHFVLQAQELNLSTCWIGWFNVKKAARFLKVPRGVKICSLLAVGHQADGWRSRIRRIKPLKDLVFENKWGQSIEF